MIQKESSCEICMHMPPICAVVAIAKFVNAFLLNLRTLILWGGAKAIDGTNPGGGGGGGGECRVGWWGGGGGTCTATHVQKRLFIRERCIFLWCLIIMVYRIKKNKQRVLMHRHQGWNVRHGLCHIYMRYLYIYIYELFIAFVCFVVCSLL